MALVTRPAVPETAALAGLSSGCSSLVVERSEGSRFVCPHAASGVLTPLPPHGLSLRRAGPRPHCLEDGSPGCSGAGCAPSQPKGTGVGAAGRRRSAGRHRGALPGGGGAGAGATGEEWREPLSPLPGAGRRESGGEIRRAGGSARERDTREPLTRPVVLPLPQLTALLRLAVVWR